MSRTVLHALAVVVILCATLVPAVVLLVGALRDDSDQEGR